MQNVMKVVGVLVLGMMAAGCAGSQDDVGDDLDDGPLGTTSQAFVVNGCNVYAMKPEYAGSPGTWRGVARVNCDAGSGITVTLKLQAQDISGWYDIKQTSPTVGAGVDAVKKTAIGSYSGLSCTNLRSLVKYNASNKSCRNACGTVITC